MVKSCLLKLGNSLVVRILNAKYIYEKGLNPGDYAKVRLKNSEITFTRKLINIGNSIGFSIPKTICKEENYKVGDEVDYTIDTGAVKSPFHRAATTYTLSQKEIWWLDNIDKMEIEKIDEFITIIEKKLRNLKQNVDFLEYKLKYIKRMR